MTSGLLAEPAATALQAAVDSVRTAVGHLIKVVDDGALNDLGAQGLVGFLAEVEQIRNTLPVVDPVPGTGSSRGSLLAAS